MIHKFCCQYYIFDKFYSMYDIAFVLFVNSVLHSICILYKLYYFIFILCFLWNSFTRHMFILRYHCVIHILSGIDHCPPFTAKKLLYLSFILLNADFIGFAPENDHCQVFFHVLLNLLISLSHLG